MKKAISSSWMAIVAGFAVSLSNGCEQAYAQTTNTNSPAVTNANTNQPPAAPAPAPLPTTTFLNDMQTWFTTFSSNQWNTAHGYFETGAAYQQNVNIASTVELGYNVWSPSSNAASGLTLCSETLNAGVAGVIDTEQLDLAWRIDFKDVQIQLGAGGGYDFVNKKGFPSAFGELQKKLTANTHAYLRLEENWEGKTSAPIVAAGVGFTF